MVDFCSAGPEQIVSNSRWTPMQEIADWLNKLGLPEYAERFADNGIDVSVLPHLTDQDFKV